MYIYIYCTIGNMSEITLYLGRNLDDQINLNSNFMAQIDKGIEKNHGEVGQRPGQFE